MASFVRDPQETAALSIAMNHQAALYPHNDFFHMG